MNTILFKTFGCKVNLYNTQLLQENILCREGYVVASHHPIDFLFVNACVVTKKAEKEVLLFCMKNLKLYPNIKIYVFGCLTTILKEELAKINVKYGTIQEILLYFSDDDSKERIFLNSIKTFQERTRAFIKVQSGCHQFCSYCIVPMVRGQEECRKPKDILMEVNQLFLSGFREVVLTGTQIGLYQNPQKPDYSFLDLMKELEYNFNQRLFRIRISSIGPTFVSKDMINFLSKSTLFCNHMHISLQSGSDDVLQKMNRKYTAQKYLDLIKQLKQARKDFCVSTDVIVGFPGETEKDFMKTIELCQQAAFSKIHVFPFSPRPGTAAYQLKSLLHPEEVKKRTNELLELSKILSYNVRRKFIGTSVEVLIEEDSSGFTTNYLRVVLQKGINRKGQLASVSVGWCDADALYESNLT